MQKAWFGTTKREPGEAKTSRRSATQVEGDSDLEPGLRKILL
jgi:hypothetical protein